jgi:MFS superfamily sulfate permease-like transporter
MRFDGRLVFVNVSYFEEQLQKLLASHKNLEVLIVDNVAINDLDASGEEMLRANFRRLKDAGIHVLFTRTKSYIMEIFKRSHLFQDIDETYFHPEPAEAYAHAWQLVAAAEQQRVEREQAEKERAQQADNGPEPA